MPDKFKADNNCGRNDNISVNLVLSGQGGNISVPADGSTCNVAHDTESTVGFGNITTTNVLAYTCFWVNSPPAGATTDWEIYESDVKMDTGHDWSGGTTCSGTKWRVEAVMSHEFGHSIGLGHASPESAHGKLTMSPAIAGLL